MRLSGKNGALYVGLSSSAAVAEPVAYIKSWDLESTTDKYDGTALGDANKIYVTGLPDASGKFAGFYDDATVQTYSASQDGQARRFYLYPNTGKAQFWSGTAFFDFSVSDDVAAIVSISGSWNAASAVTKTG